MGPPAAGPVVEPGPRLFAERLRRAIGPGRVLLFGSRARGQHRPDSDYDFIIVSSRFCGVPRRERGDGLRDIFYEAVGPAPMDLICLTPEEFEEAKSRITLIAAVLPEALDLLAPAEP